jgi:hypothetical protein
MCCDTPACDISSRCAAADTEPVSTKATQMPNCSHEGGDTLSEARFFMRLRAGCEGFHWFL